MAPEMLGAGITYPDRKFGVAQARREDIAFIYNVPDPANYYQFLFEMPRKSARCMSGGLRVYARSASGQRFVWIEDRVFDADADDNFARIQYVAGAFSVDSTTISTTTTNLEGVASGAVLGFTPEYRTLTTSNLDDYAIQGHRAQLVPLTDGVRAGTLPFTVSSFEIPHLSPQAHELLTDSQDFDKLDLWYSSAPKPISPNVGTWTVSPAAGGNFVSLTPSTGLPNNLRGRMRISGNLTGLNVAAGTQQASVVVRVSYYVATSPTDPTPVLTNQDYRVFSGVSSTVINFFDVTFDIAIDVEGHIVENIAIVQPPNGPTFDLTQPDCMVHVHVDCYDSDPTTLSGQAIILVTEPGDRQLNINGTIHYAAVPTPDTQRLLRLAVTRMHFTQGYSDIVHNYLLSNPDSFRAVMKRSDFARTLGNLPTLTSDDFIARHTGFWSALKEGAEKVGEFLINNRHKIGEVMSLAPNRYIAGVGQILRNTTEIEPTDFTVPQMERTLSVITRHCTGGPESVRVTGNCNHCCGSVQSSDDDDGDVSRASKIITETLRSLKSGGLQMSDLTMDHLAECLAEINPPQEPHEDFRLRESASPLSSPCAEFSQLPSREPMFGDLGGGFENALDAEKLFGGDGFKLYMGTLTKARFDELLDQPLKIQRCTSGRASYASVATPPANTTVTAEDFPALSAPASQEFAGALNAERVLGTADDEEEGEDISELPDPFAGLRDLRKCIVINADAVGKESGWSQIGIQLLRGKTIFEAFPDYEVQHMQTNVDPDTVEDADGYTLHSAEIYDKTTKERKMKAYKNALTTNMKAFVPGGSSAGTVLGMAGIRVSEIVPSAVNCFPQVLKVEGTDKKITTLGVAISFSSENPPDHIIFVYHNPDTEENKIKVFSPDVFQYNKVEGVSFSTSCGSENINAVSQALSSLRQAKMNKPILDMCVAFSPIIDQLVRELLAAGAAVLNPSFHLMQANDDVIIGNSASAAIFCGVMGFQCAGPITGSVGFTNGAVRLGKIGDLEDKLRACVSLGRMIYVPRGSVTSSQRSINDPGELLLVGRPKQLVCIGVDTPGDVVIMPILLGREGKANYANQLISERNELASVAKSQQSYENLKQKEATLLAGEKKDRMINMFQSVRAALEQVPVVQLMKGSLDSILGSDSFKFKKLSFQGANLGDRLQSGQMVSFAGTSMPYPEAMARLMISTIRKPQSKLLANADSETGELTKFVSQPRQTEEGEAIMLKAAALTKSGAAKTTKSKTKSLAQRAQMVTLDLPF
jgi:hypothetical protein